MSIETPSPRRGEIWVVNFDPTIGAEINKTRPAVVVSSDAVGKLPVKLIAPITEWKQHYARNLWHVRIGPDRFNNLEKDSAVDALQLRSVDVRRFVRRMGRVSSTIMEEIAAAISMIVEYK
ncbi:MAG: type II toxin-antitoxin system PemK/MazF family toxin [Chloroflexi bacterium]|nr:type II toxin-antitoxin system PemK/MazF family toxin [Chloroflexota bacterium]